MEESGGKSLIRPGIAAVACRKASFLRASVLCLGSLAIVGLLYSFSYSQDGYWHYLLSSRASLSKEEAELKHVLNRVSMENKTLIITVINRAYAENNSMLELFLQSFHQGVGTQHLVQHLLIVSLDQPAFDRCRQLHLHCYKLITDGVDFSGEKLFMSEDYLKMMWRRILFIEDVLRRGYNILFTDADILWLRNPFTRLSTEDDMQISCDRYNGRPYDNSNDMNAGFYFVRPNNKTIELYKLWYKSKEIGGHDQDVLQKLQERPEFQKLGLRIRFIDTLYFAGFCEMSRDMREVNTVHANCCRSMKAKLMDLGAFQEAWKKFMVTEYINGSSAGTWPDAEACRASWRR